MSAKQIHDAAQRGISELDGGVPPHRALRGFLVAIRDATATAADDEKPAKRQAEKKTDDEKAAAEKKGK